MSRTILALVLAASCSGCAKRSQPTPGDRETAESAPRSSAAERALAAFAGEVELFFDSEGHLRVDFTLETNGENVRLALPAELRAGAPFAGTFLLLLRNEQKLYFVNEPQRSAILVDLAPPPKGQPAGPSPFAKQRLPGDKPPIQAKATKTGAHETVAGYDCEVMRVDDPAPTGAYMDLCVAPVRADWFALPPPLFPEDHAWARTVVDGKHLPLRAVFYKPSGIEAGRIEVRRFQRKLVDHARFEIPEGFATNDLANRPLGRPPVAPPGMIPYGGRPR